jgi:hypothetical protein
MLKFALTIMLLGGSPAIAATEPWAFERDPDLGFHFSYPPGLFRSVPGDEAPVFRYFASANAVRSSVLSKSTFEAWRSSGTFATHQFSEWSESR